MPVNTPQSASSDLFLTLGCGVLIPTYNNAKTLEQLIHGVLEYTDRIILVNDGATDDTASILQRFPQLTVITHPLNEGKGMALRHGFAAAREAGYRYIITIDSDGQHFPSDFHLFLEKIKENPDALIIGARNMTVDNVPGKSTFGNRFSNFWYVVVQGECRL